jgi:hypothetical protein
MMQWGSSGEKPVPADYDGDGKTDFAVWKSNDEWSIRQSTTGTGITITSGDQSSDIPVQGDYDGDGKADPASWRPSNGTWYIKQSATGTQRVQAWGMAGDVPVPAHYGR